MRLDKRICEAGYTRSQARALIAAGRVCVNGAAVRDAGAHVEPDAPVSVDGRAVGAPRTLHLMMHKPDGVLTAARDAHSATVMDLLPSALRARALSPVGRLDKDVTGLLLLTEDGQLAHRLISPRWNVEKIYRARVDGPLDERHVQRMAAGIALSDFTAKPARLRILESGEQSLAELSVTEGKYHQVKRMFGALERPVLQLKRVQMGGVALDEALAPGQTRELTPEEIERLYRLVALNP